MLNFHHVAGFPRLQHNSFVDFEIFVFVHTLYVFYHLHVISDCFSNILPQKILHFLYT